MSRIIESHQVYGNVDAQIKKLEFCLFVDDFGLKYSNIQDAQEFLDNLGTKYKCTVEWSGNHFCGLTFDSEYVKVHVEISISRYVIEALERL